MVNYCIDTDKEDSEEKLGVDSMVMEVEDTQDHLDISMSSGSPRGWSGRIGRSSRSIYIRKSPENSHQNAIICV